MSSGEEFNIDKYKLINCLAGGQHSQVWEVIDGARRVAMKLLVEKAFKDLEQKNALKHEAKVGGSFEHPNIIKYYETVVNKQHAYFIMDLFNAPNIKTQIFNDLNGVHLRIKRVVEQVALALAHVHEKGWLHRDIKPDNILSNKSSEVRVIDFSLADRATGALGKIFGKKKKVIQGTRTYMAPEQILQKPISPATDLYNLGITVFEMLTGEPPFKGANPKDLLIRHINEPAPAPSFFNSNVTPEMDRLVLKMIAKKPEQRFKSMSEFLVEFRRTNIFKEPIAETVAPTAQQLHDESAKGLDKRLDSRSDALRGGKSAPVAVPAAAPPRPAVAAPVQVAAPLAAVRAPVAAPAPAAAPRPAAPVMAPPRPPAPAPPPAPLQPARAPAPQPRPAAAAPPAPQPVRAPVAAPPPAKAPPAPAAGARPPQKPAAHPPPARAPAPPAPKPQPAAKPADDGGMNIDDLPGFDDLPPVL